MRYSQYADDLQLFLSFFSDPMVSALSQSLAAVQDWILVNKMKISLDNGHEMMVSKLLFSGSLI